MAFIGSDWNDDFDDDSPIGISSSMKEDIGDDYYCTEKNTMSNEKFTQGEWFVECGNEINTEQKNICRCIRLAMEPEETAANAALIAAAPKMYEKLKEIQYLFYTFSFRLLRCNEKKNAEQWIKKSMEIDKLLRKARGEE